MIEVNLHLRRLLSSGKIHNADADIPHKYRNKKDRWFSTSHKKTKKLSKEWLSSLKRISLFASRCTVTVSVSELKNLSIGELAELREYVLCKNMLASMARLAIHQAIRGIGSSCVNSEEFRSWVTCLGPIQSSRIMADAKGYDLNRPRLRKVQGCYGMGKRR